MSLSEGSDRATEKKFHGWRGSLWSLRTYHCWWFLSLVTAFYFLSWVKAI